MAIEKKEKLYDIWVRRNPTFETKYEKPIFRELSNYGNKSSQYTSIKGKILGPAYEVYIIAFFIGLYLNKTKSLSDETKTLGQPINFWGNTSVSGIRKAYPNLKEYIFAALVARSDIDLIQLEKDEITPKRVVDILITKMEEYTNYGLSFIQEKSIEVPDFFYRNTSFLDLFLDITKDLIPESSNYEEEEDDDDDEIDINDDENKPEPLD